MNIDKKEVGKRLKEFSAKFKSMAELARALQMERPQQLYQYLNGRSLPGFELVAKLRDLGCDPNWLIAGETTVPSLTTTAEKIQYESEKTREEVEGQIDKVVKMAQISFGTMKPAETRELREALRRWAIKRYQANHDDTARSPKKGAKAK